MKRLLLLIAILLLISSASATRLTFQNPEDFSEQVVSGKSPGSAGLQTAWIYNSTGGNSYIETSIASVAGGKTWYRNSASLPVTYAASTVLNFDTGMTPYIRLEDSSNTLMKELVATALPNNTGRWEVTVDSSGVARVWKDHILIANLGTVSANPSYIGFGAFTPSIFAKKVLNWDNTIWGDDNAGFIFGMPLSNGFIIKKDFTNPANRGFAYASNGTVIDSHYMWSNYGKPNTLNESIILQNYGTGQTVATFYPGTSMSGDIYWNLDNAIFNNPQADYGLYVVKSTNASAVLPSATIEYIGYGASVSFNAVQYVPLDTARVTWAISSGGYWNTSGYDYRLAIRDSYGTFVSNTSITTQNGFVNYQFKSTDQQGVYYAIVLAISKSTGEEIWMATDYANLLQYVAFNGYVNAAQTGLPLIGATYNFSQGAVQVNSTTLSDGSYNISGFFTGSNITINVSKSGYVPYLVDIVPQTAHRIPLNFTLCLTSPFFRGFAIGGVVRTGQFSNGFVTGGYGEPVSSATVNVYNLTTSQFYTTTSNNVGWWLIDANTPSSLFNATPYSVNGSKAGFGNSQVYTVILP